MSSDRKGGLFEGRPGGDYPQLEDPIIGFDKAGENPTPGFALLEEKEIKIYKVPDYQEPEPFGFSERREDVTCDADGCRAYRTLIDGRVAPHPARVSLKDGAGSVPPDYEWQDWVSRDGKDYCPEHVPVILNSERVVEDPFSDLNPPLSPEARAALEAGLESARSGAVGSLGDFTKYANDEPPPPPIALVAASTDQTGVRWDAVFYVAVGVLLAALVWCAVEYLK